VNRRRQRFALRALTSLAAIVAAGVLGAASMASGPAFADSGLSSIVIPRALPGMVEEPPGPLNGALTPSDLGSVFGHSAPVEAMSQAIEYHDVHAYLRMWSNEPPNGAFVTVVAAQFPSAADVSDVLAGADHALQSGQFGHFSVPQIPHAFGVTAIMNTQTGLVSEEMAVFAKGTILFEVTCGQLTTAANSGAPEFSEADTIQIASRQAALAPGSAIGPSTAPPENAAYKAGQDFAACALIALVAGLVVFLVRRGGRRSGPRTSQIGAGSAPQWGEYRPGPAPPVPPTPDVSGPPGTASPLAQARTALLDQPVAGGRPGFYCCWCGNHVLVGEPVAHDCGPRDRPALHCMRCGAPFEGATVCSSCGSPKLQ
jgi:hypothetical protein